MTEQQRQQRAAFIRDQPGLWLLLLYSVAFLSCTAAIDALGWAGLAAHSGGMGYLLPLVVALPAWVGLRGWARRTSACVACGSGSVSPR
jgi:hypothetical protein